MPIDIDDCAVKGGRSINPSMDYDGKVNKFRIESNRVKSLGKQKQI
jgi:hypothetical protein